MKKSLVLVVLALALLFVVGVSSAFADTATVTAGAYTARTATDTVTVNATVNAKLVLQVTTPAAAQAVNFGAVVPGTAYGTQPVDLTVWSNKGYTISETKSGDTTIGLSTVGSIPGAYAKSATNAGQTFNDLYSLNVPWNTDPGAYTATVLYTVLQNP